MKNNKLSISNIAWPHENHAEILTLIAKCGVSGIEIAPTKLADWNNLSIVYLKEFRQKLENLGLVCSGLQAIFFSKPDCQLLASEAEFMHMYSHLDYVADIAYTLGTNKVVFGAPRNRKANGINQHIAWDLAVERFRKLAEKTQDRISIGIEAIPSIYACDFLTRTDQVISMINSIEYKSIRLHFDAACSYLAGEDLKNSILLSSPYIASFHISEPELKPLSFASSYHQSAADALNIIKFDGWLTIEMNQTNYFESEIKQSIKTAQNIYNS
jgi:D-psicose/D-tagatose/L-ribulose 3-epimerase